MIEELAVNKEFLTDRLQHRTMKLFSEEGNVIESCEFDNARRKMVFGDETVGVVSGMKYNVYTVPNKYNVYTVHCT